MSTLNVNILNKLDEINKFFEWQNLLKLTYGEIESHNQKTYEENSRPDGFID